MGSHQVKGYVKQYYFGVEKVAAQNYDAIRKGKGAEIMTANFIVRSMKRTEVNLMMNWSAAESWKMLAIVIH